MQGNYFFIVPAVPEKCRGFNIGTLTPVRSSVVTGGAKSRVVTIRLSPQGRAYTRALKIGKVNIPAHPRRWGGGGGQWIQMTGALGAQ